MSFAFIREGDPTSHGGIVLTCNPANTSDGKALALLGDMVSCPRCGGIFPIVKVKTDLNVRFDSRPVASDGDMTACGATLIASSNGTRASPTTGAGSSIGGGRSVVSHRTSDSNETHRGRFQVLDDNTGKPVANHSYTVTSSNGQTIKGTTDGNGFTDWLETSQAASLIFKRSGTDTA